MKLRIVLRIPQIKFKHWRAGRIHKKSIKLPERYEEQWKFDYAIKQAKKMLKILKIKLNVIGYENLPKKSYLLTPNHQSSLDPLILIIAMEKQTHDRDISNKRIIFLGKKSLASNKNIKNYAKLIGCRFFDRKKPREALKTMNELSVYIKKNRVGITIFPEGTRSKDGQIGEFKAGSFRMVKKDFLPVVPVTINNSREALNLKKNNRTVDVIFHKPLKPLRLIAMSNKDIATKVRKIVLSKYVEFNPKKNVNEKHF